MFSYLAKYRFITDMDRLRIPVFDRVYTPFKDIPSKRAQFTVKPTIISQRAYQFAVSCVIKFEAHIVDETLHIKNKYTIITLVDHNQIVRHLEHVFCQRRDSIIRYVTVIVYMYLSIGLL